MSLTNYESVFIAAPTLSNEAFDQLVSTFEEIITTNGGELVATNKWGRKTLAYEIANFTEGIYTHIEFDGDGDLVKELERRYRLTDSVIRYLTVRLDRPRKLVAKGNVKKKRKEARNKRRKDRMEKANLR
jgi:small subunit ribosomal protein S6